MKIALLILSATISFSALANTEAEPNRSRYNCFYRDTAMGHTYGALAERIGTAKARARLYCEEALDRYDLSGRCVFVRCRIIETLEEL